MNMVNYPKKKYEEVMEEGRAPRVPRSKGIKGPRFRDPKVPRYLNVAFKYELDSKEGPSCIIFFPAHRLQ